MTKVTLFVILSFISHVSYGEVISLECSGYPIKVTTFPDSLKTTVYVNDKNLNRVEDGWTWKLQGFEITDSKIEFTESMNPPSNHRHDWVNPQTHYKINRLTGSLEMYRKELNGDGKVLSEHGYPIDKCTSIKRKF